MNLLYSNDRPGQYPPSWYAATAEGPAAYEPLKGEVKAEVCVVGGGHMYPFLLRLLRITHHLLCVFD